MALDFGMFSKFPLHIHGEQRHAAPVEEPAPKEPEQPKMKAMRVVICDSAGIRRCRVIPASQYPKAQSIGIGMTRGCMGMAAHQDGVVPNSGLAPVGEIRLMPVGSCEFPLPWAPGHHMVLAEMHDHPGKEWACCPRSALRRALHALQKEYALSLRVGFEHEFVLLKGGSAPYPQGAPELPLTPVDESAYAQTSGLDEHSAVLDEMVDALHAMGIQVQQWHAESGPGQYEIATQHFEALEAADMCIATREAICGVARKHGLVACFLPKPLSFAAGSGAHMHFSLWREGENVMAAPGTKVVAANSAGGAASIQLGEHATHFLAGVLQSLPAMMAFTAASINSYQRLTPDTWTGVHVAWGWDNREVPLRLTVPPQAAGVPDGDGVNAELKTVDATSNPYLAITALVAGGVMGLFLNLPLPPPIQVNPSTMTQDELSSARAVRLPVSLHEALQCLQGNSKSWTACEGFKAMMLTLTGGDLLDAYVAVKEAEVAAEALQTPMRMYTRY